MQALTRPLLAAFAVADACAALARTLYALPLACPAPVYRGAVRLAEVADSIGDSIGRIASLRYCARMLGVARTWRKAAHYGGDTAPLARALARAYVHDCRAYGRAIGAPGLRPQ